MITIESAKEYLKNNGIPEEEINNNIDRITKIIQSIRPDLKEELAYQRVLKYYRDPNILDKISNLFNSTVNHIANGMPQSTEDEKNRRLSICNSCEQYDNGKCKICGCILSIKAGWANESCPLDKWQVKKDNNVGAASPPGGCGCGKK